QCGDRACDRWDQSYACHRDLHGPSAFVFAHQARRRRWRILARHPVCPDPHRCDRQPPIPERSSANDRGTFALSQPLRQIEVARMSNRNTVVVTGASAGVGRAVAIAFAQKGWNVALIARGKEGLEGARQDVEAAGGHALVLPLDVADPDAVFAAADQVMAEWGRIDVWVNDAMVTIFAPVKEIKP